MTIRPPYRTVRALIHAHVGRPAVVIGGGPSAPRELEAAPRDGALFLSVNAHGFKLHACDYAVALDKIESQLRPFGVPLISRHVWADYRILQAPQPNSGIVAAWVARLMGCRPVWLCGMDCYDGAVYFHDARAETPAKSESPDIHLGRWREFFAMYRGDFRVLGGPLASVLAERLVRDRLAGAVTRETLEREVAGRFVQLTRDVTLGACARPFTKGETLELRVCEADKLVSNRQARRVRPEANAA